MSDYACAQSLHASMTADGLSYMPMGKDELREQLQIGRIENRRANQIVIEFRKAGLLMQPAPTRGQEFVRIFRLDTDLGRFVQELMTATGSEEDERTFESGARRLEGASPPEVFRRLRTLFVEEGWVPPARRTRSAA